MVIFHSYVAVYQRVILNIQWQWLKSLTHLCMIFRHLSRDFSERQQPRGSKRKMKTKQPRGGFGFFMVLNGWLVVLTLLKNISQLG
jgi:hypothetical protein